MAQVDCYTGRRSTVGEAGGRTPHVSAVTLLNYIACSTECQFDFGWRWVRRWGRRLGVSISDSIWSWVVGLLMSGEGHGELQRQHLYPRRAAKNCNCNTFFRGGPRRHAENCNCNTFFREGPRRTAKNYNCHTLFHEGPRRATENCNCNTFFRGGPRRHAENCNINFFSHGGPRRTATAMPFSTKGREEGLLFFWVVLFMLGGPGNEGGLLGALWGVLELD